MSDDGSLPKGGPKKKPSKGFIDRITDDGWTYTPPEKVQQEAEQERQRRLEAQRERETPEPERQTGLGENKRPEDA